MELIDALHLRGWRPFLLAIVVALGALVGALLPQDSSYTSDHILFASQLSDDSLSPAQIEDFADELRLAATLPSVKQAVIDQVGEGYSVVVSATASDTSIRFASEGPTEEGARLASQLTGVEAANFVIGQTVTRSQSLSESLNEQLQGVISQQDEITTQAGGISPPDAVDTASELLFVARQAVDNGVAGAQAEVTDLEAEIAALRPLEIAYVQLEQEAVQLTSELSRTLTDISQAQNALTSVTSVTIIAEVATNEKSTVPATVQNMLLFAALNAFVIVLIFILIDRFTGKAQPGQAEPGHDELNDALLPTGGVAVASSALAAEGAVRFGRRSSDTVVPVESLARPDQADALSTEPVEADLDLTTHDDQSDKAQTATDDNAPDEKAADKAADEAADPKEDDEAEAEAVALANTGGSSDASNSSAKSNNRSNSNNRSKSNRNKGSRTKGNQR